MYQAIYLSPHLDDAALSCGGQIARQTAVGKEILIVTIMAGDPASAGLSAYAQELHGRWQLAQNAVVARRTEDKNACTILQAACEQWSVPDCIYRLDADGRALYTNWAEITGVIPQAEQPLLQTLAERFARLPAGLKVLAPLAVGNHVDHQMVRRAAEICFGYDLYYYEDFPYTRDEAALTAVIPPGDPTWHSQIIPLTSADLAAKVAAIAAYSSQLSTFFHGRADLEQQIHQYAARVGGERLWQRIKPMDA
jgi:LmbE family N-acetylglucosaminyl deacetylase